MATIDLIGSMSWEPTVPCYREIDEATKSRLRGRPSVRIALFSVDVQDIERRQHGGDWNVAERHGIEVLGPVSAERDLVQRVIQEELCLGVLNATSRAAYRDAIARLVECGAESIIPDCTKIALRVDPEDASVPLFDTAAIHAQAAIERALDDEP